MKIVHFSWEFNSICYQRLDSEGNVLAGNMEVSQGWSVTNSSIAVDSNNDVHIVWQSEKSNGWDVYYRKLDSNGDALTSEIKLNSEGRSCNTPSVAVDSGGNVHIAWWDDRNEEHFKPGQINWEIYYKKLDIDGNTLTDDIRITNVELGSYYPSIAVDANNNVHIVWYDNGYADSGIFYCKLSS